jgi:transposase InsO family protein
METDERKQQREQIALFRYGLVAELLHLRPSEGLYKKLEEQASKSYAIPGTTRTRVAAETVRGWLGQYRKDGFEGLMPRARKDVGSTRALPQEVLDLLVTLKEENPRLTVPQVIADARNSGLVALEIELAPSTVHRLLSRRGLMKKPSAGGQDHRRFEYPKAGDLWMSDVMHGPAICRDGSKRKAKVYLIAFIDDASRVVPFAMFCWSENTAAFLPVLKQALMRRGLPKRLFVDNGAAYRSKQLALVCARLGITLIHARAHHPQAKAKQERWFRTVRQQLLTRLTADDLSSLAALNRRLWAWVEAEYHQSPHRGLNEQTPLDRWAQVGNEVRWLEPGIDLDDVCLIEARRKVHKDRTVSLCGVVYEVEACLVDSSVLLRYDPERLAAKKSIQVWDDRGKRMADAKVVDVYANCFVKRDRGSGVLAADGSPDAPKPSLSLSTLRARNQEVK